MLVISGVEVNPGPPTAIYLIDQPIMNDNQTVNLVMVFKDGKITGNFREGLKKEYTMYLVIPFTKTISLKSDIIILC